MYKGKLSNHFVAYEANQDKERLQLFIELCNSSSGYLIRTSDYTPKGRFYCYTKKGSDLYISVSAQYD
ncbi:uncharacterized protein CANTADRAFT_115622 [Suhomyces tanzawaensis NRRL Y-17324]|uniref:Uncharacterized protein n=1 Tax=Suhomyces tanzawaensis NRRL Y-17324 TaxID=984487 RepID=A0A1E4SQ32_9ASCO|nr:uncharacterized protein CANTADRAFT_115622 [Suhomyces tanzawaensis NRRL Y-17324]ODV81620.1 hypothetical protein CANTADRAFT_115622 [Suhomyces tanzawaensis NRRL Y-17324]